MNRAKRLSRVLVDLRGDGIYLAHYCQACAMPHTIHLVPNGWVWDGNAEAPTFGPSFKHSWPGAGMRHTHPQPGGKENVCHCIITAGQIHYCADSTHAMAGQTVPMSDYPEKWI